MIDFFGKSIMQTTQLITTAQLDKVIHAIYVDGPPVVKEAYSKLDTPTATFPLPSDLRANIQYVPGQNEFFHYALYYPAAKGHVIEKRSALKFEGSHHAHRFSQEGWGLIFLQLTFRDHSRIECRVAVNSSSRAEKWFATYPELKSPDLWDWKVVKRQAGRLVRLLRKLGRPAEPPAQGKADKQGA